MKNVAIFASGSGTNAENIARYFSHSETVRIAVAVSNKAAAGVHARMQALGVPTLTLGNREFAEGTPVLAVLREYKIDFIVLAGFLAMIPPALLEAYPGRIVNIHPALLPKFGGKGMYGMRVHEAVVEAGETESGITIHYIDEHYDRGTTVFQATCPVLPEDTPETVAAKVHALEYEHFPKVIEKLLA